MTVTVSVLVGLASVAMSGGGGGRPVAHPPDVKPDPSHPVHAPLTYYQRQCASCHGDYGEWYTFPFATDDLRGTVDEMADGPGMAPLDPDALAVQVRLHEAMASGGPFATARARDQVWTGELLPGTRVWLVTDAGEVAADVDGHTWTARVDVAVSAVKATRGENKIRIDPL